MEKNLQPKLKRAQRVPQKEGLNILAKKFGGLRTTAKLSIAQQGQNGISVGAKYKGIRRDEFGGRGADRSSTY